MINPRGNCEERATSGPSALRNWQSAGGGQPSAQGLKPSEVERPDDSPLNCGLLAADNGSGGALEGHYGSRFTRGVTTRSTVSGENPCRKR